MQQEQERAVAHVAVTIPACAFAAVEDASQESTIAIGRAEVRIVDQPRCGVWEGRTLRISVPNLDWGGEVRVEVALDAFPRPGAAIPPGVSL